MYIEDLIILGTACPEPMRDGRTSVCVAGYSHKHGFIRVYPSSVDMKLKMWSIVKIPLEKNPQDTRFESWKIQGSKHEWDHLYEKIEFVGNYKKKYRRDLISNLEVGCVNNLNDQNKSLGIVKPKINDYFFVKNEEYSPNNQVDLYGMKELKTRKNHRFIPRVKYFCRDCQVKTIHHQQIVEWGFYEWIRKYPDRKNQVWDNAKFNSKKHDIYFLVGNIFKHRKSFIVISVIRLPKLDSAQKTLFPLKK